MPTEAVVHEELSNRLRRVLPSARAERTELTQLPELELYLLNADFRSDLLTREQTQAVLEYPAYWAFCWASGQALARYLLDRPEQVAGRCVLDFGCGSGVVGIAAAKAGATHVIACDLDPDALFAAQCNAQLNGVSLELASGFDAVEADVDLILAADVLYDRGNFAWLPRLLARAPALLLADSRVKDFSAAGFRWLGRWHSQTVPDLDEFDQFRWVDIHRGECRPR
jgi:predicted nicotinamide N-methyase